MQEDRVIGVIPARLQSTRLSEKVLRKIAGRPMIQHVWNRAKASQRLQDVIVACDDVRIQEVVEGFGGKAMMTRPDHPNGTSRIAEVAAATDGSVYVNIQGDEPLLNPANIDRLVEKIIDSEMPMATLAVPKCSREYSNPNVVKVVCDAKGRALYFSRASIPFHRDCESEEGTFLKHVGIYAYQKDFLLEFANMSMGTLEGIEKLEQLRVLEMGYGIQVVEVSEDSIGVDTEEDLEKVNQMMLNQKEVS